MHVRVGPTVHTAMTAMVGWGLLGVHLVTGLFCRHQAHILKARRLQNIKFRLSLCTIKINSSGTWWLFLRL